MRRTLMLVLCTLFIVTSAAPALAEIPPEPPSWDEFRSRAVTRQLEALPDDPASEVVVLKTLPVITQQARAEWEEWKASYDENVAWQEARETAEAAEAAQPVAVAPGPAPAVSGDIYDALAQCESGGNPATNTGNGYYGAFQFLVSTWQSLGYSGLPTDHSYATQKQAAIALIARSGWGQFPGCAAQLGML